MDIPETKDYLILLVVGTGVLFTLSAGLIIFFIRYQRKILKQQKEMHDLEKNYNHDLLVASFKSVEEERKRIAQDLHDDIGSIFSTLKLKLEQIGKEHPYISFDDSNYIIQSGIEGVRTISHNLTPYGIEMFGLPTAVQHFCDKINHTNQLKINLYKCEKFPELSDDVAINVYRIIQEMISNTIKHAEAKEINLKINCSHDRLIIDYEDDGKGMNTKILKQLDGHGLKNTESRLRMLGSNYKYSTEPGKGFHLSFNVPLQQNWYAKN